MGASPSCSRRLAKHSGHSTAGVPAGMPTIWEHIWVREE